MGQIHRYNIQYIIDKYNISIYIETGTGEGISLTHVLKNKFKHFYSIDLDYDLIQSAIKKFADIDNLTFIKNFSTEALNKLIPDINQNDNILFFLDAHFPGADFHKMTYENSIKTFKKQAFPLEDELKKIISLRDIKNDVFIIDDFILYEPNHDYETIKQGVTYKYKWLQDELNIITDSNIIYKMFEKTHNFELSIKDQGYLLITPKKNEI